MAREVDWGRSDSTIAEQLLLQAQVLYPFILLLAFGVVFAVHSVIASRRQEDIEKPTVTGPGGKPLPVTRIKVEKSHIRYAAAHEFSPRSSFCFKAGTAVIVLTFAWHGVHIVLQCVKTAWVDTARFCSDELLVSSFLSHQQQLGYLRASG